MGDWENADVAMPGLFALAPAGSPAGVLPSTEAAIPLEAFGAGAHEVGLPLAGDASAAWHYERDGAAAGPVTLSDLRRLVADHSVAPQTRVWAEGMGDWQAAHQALPALFAGAGATFLEPSPVALQSNTAVHAPPAYGYLPDPAAP